MQTLILCGGKGTRAYPHTAEVPKPLMELAGSPILLHIMEIYARQGFDRFVLSAGYRADLIADFAAALSPGWDVRVEDTGEGTGTAGRVIGCASVLDPTFMATYGDGLAPLDLRALLEFHRGHPGAMTVTAVPLPSPYGTLEWDERGRVRQFLEKPRLPDHWINAGFFVIEQRAFDLWEGDDLEREVLPALAAAGELYVYRHSGFWRSMDTYKDALELTELCQEGDGPWTILPAPGSSSPEPLVSSDHISPAASSRAGAEVHALTSTVSSVYPVRLVDLRDRITLHGGNLNDSGAMAALVELARPEVVFHLGAYTHVGKSWARIDECIQTNVHGTVNLLQALERSDYRRFVYTSTSEVYGDIPVPFREDAAVDPSSPYSVSKYSGERFCRMLNRGRSWPIVVVRPFNAYGPAQSPDRIIPEIIVKALRKERLAMTQGRQTREFNYVEDLVDGFVRAATVPGMEGEVFNIGGGEEVSIRDVARTILDLMGNPIAA